MIKLQNVIETIKEIECPVDEIEDKLKSAYGEYVEDSSYIFVTRKEELDTMGLKAYELNTDKNDYKAILALVREGEEHYVSNVEDAYVK